MTDLRDKILDVTISVYAENGYRGTTTRRIAAEAGVNEVTLFRHFGSKDELIKAALRREHRRIMGDAPDAVHVDPAVAIEQWAIGMHQRFHAHNRVIRQLLGDAQQRPDLVMEPGDDCEHEVKAIIVWFDALKAQGRLADDADTLIAGHMLVNTLFTDALWRDHTPPGVVPPAEEVIRRLVAFTLRALGYASADVAGGREVA